jgi:hypothetical protein
MNQRLVWNFEFALKASESLTMLTDKKDELKWEQRYFWPDNQPILLNLMDPSLIHLTRYTLKHKEDYYYLLPNSDYNLKQRHNQLVYKPLLSRVRNAVGYGSKIILDPLPLNPLNSELIALNQRIEKEGVGICVDKEVFIHTLSTTPPIKIELARLELMDTLYFSLCVEGKSLYLVETVSKLLLGEQVSCEYVTFLRTILNL